MDYMETGGVFNTWYDNWFDAAANVLQDDGSTKVCRLKQQCTPTRADRKWVTTVTDVMILNDAVVLDVARGTQCNTQGVGPCKLPIDSLPLQLVAMSPDLMVDLSKQTRQNFPTTVVGWPTIRNKSLLSFMEIYIYIYTYKKFDKYKILKDDVPIRHRVTPQGPVINLFGNIVTQYTWNIPRSEP